MKRWTLFKKAAQRPNTWEEHLELNQPAKADDVTFMLAAGNRYTWLTGSVSGTYLLLLVLLVLHLVELVAFCFHTLVKRLFIKSLSTWRPIVCVCVWQCDCVHIRATQSWRWSRKITPCIFRLWFFISIFFEGGRRGAQKAHFWCARFTTD